MRRTEVSLSINFKKCSIALFLFQSKLQFGSKFQLSAVLVNKLSDLACKWLYASEWPETLSSYKAFYKVFLPKDILIYFGFVYVTKVHIQFYIVIVYSNIS